MSTEGYPVQQAAQRLDWSESTVIRAIKSGTLQLVPGSRPRMVKKESVDAAVAAKLERMGIHVQAPVSGGEQALRISHLEEEVTRLRGALADLTAAHSATLDTFRRLSEGSIPNN